MSDIPAHWTVVASATNATATATKAAAAGMTHYITGVTISGSAVAAAAATATVKDGATTVDLVNLAAAVAPQLVIEYGFPIRCAKGAKAEAILTTLGSGVVGTVSIRGFSRA
jgi:hypothetical protein